MSRAVKPTVTILLALTFAVAHGADKLAVKCSAGKQKAAVKKVGADLKCYQKAAADDVVVDPACLAKADTKFSESIAKIEAKGGCIITGDEAAIDQAADECVADIRGLTPVSPPTCGDGDFPECGGTCPAGQTCLALIVHDTNCSPGQGMSTTCNAVCRCVDASSACDGQPCGRICKRFTRSLQCGGSPLTETCCGNFGARCDATTGDPACCCAATCFEPPFGGGGGNCIQSLVCDASGSAALCQ
jgi:hypothetical protein